jgi:hypothetical protein
MSHIVLEVPEASTSHNNPKKTLRITQPHLLLALTAELQATSRA